MRTYLKNKLKQEDWAVADVVECLPSKCEALSSIPDTAKNKKRKKEKEEEGGGEREELYSLAFITIRENLTSGSTKKKT
jgi:hypothetical protein